MEAPVVMLFEKVLSISDVKSQLLLFKPCADALFPIVGETKIFCDPRGRTFELRHAFNGNLGRHRLSKDWRQFVRETRAAEGDTLILKKDAAGRFCIDLRRTSPKLERHQDVVQPVARRRPRGVPPPAQEHWSSFFVEADFQFIKDNGLNAVRIPVGWWIAYESSPPPPYVGGSLEALDNAFSWADKYGLKVIIDLHAAPGCQNPDDHSGRRDGYIEFGAGNTVEVAVTVIEFLSRRYANEPSLIAMELINEPKAVTNDSDKPRAEGVTKATLREYYQLGYDAGRRYTSTAYVIFSARLSVYKGEMEFISLASGLSGTVIDVHYYNLYVDFFKTLTAQQNIDFVKTERAKELAAISPANGWPLSFVGEWTAEWKAQNASQSDRPKFAQAQLEVYGTATFGWAYWTYRNVNKYWSLEWMIKNGCISLV